MISDIANIDYPTAKLAFLSRLFGPIGLYLESKNIVGLWLPALLIDTLLYVRILRRRNKNAKWRWTEIGWLIIGAGATLECIVFQVWLYFHPHHW